MRLKIIIIFLFILLSGVETYSQYVSTPVINKDIYSFVDILQNKGLIEINDQIKPYSRKQIADVLLLIKSKESQLTDLEKEELEFYFKEYGLEMEINQSVSAEGEVQIARKDEAGRYRLFSYSDKLFKVNLSPIIGYEKGSINKQLYTHSWTGLGFYGYLGDKIGFSFDYRDNSEKGENIDRTKSFSPVTGTNVVLAKNNEIQYSEVHATLSTDWSWGNVTIGKEFMEWGYGESGKLVLSQKAPSFPFIRLDINPIEWLHFNYIHGWLNSGVLDSAASYPSYRKSVSREIYRNKYLASHTLSINPFTGLNVSIGESVIYSDKLEIAYLMPLMFFRLADHYLSQGSNDAGSNSQFFASISSRNHIKNTHLYATGYIDEITISGLTDPTKQRTQVAFSLGGSVTDLPVENLTTTLEYTKIYPFVYKHYIPTQTYANSGYQLGHWIGDNADMIYASLDYRFIRGLQATVWGEHIRKGIYDFNEGVEAQYKVPQPPFLWGLRSNYTFAGAEIKYEFIHELFARARYQYNMTETEQKTGGFVKQNSDEFYFAVYYGL